MTSGDFAAARLYIERMKHLNHDVVSNVEELQDLCVMVNSILNPRSWIGLDDEGRIHITRLKRNLLRAATQERLDMYVDCVWEFCPTQHIFTCIKCRDGRFSNTQCQAPASHVP